MILIKRRKYLILKVIHSISWILDKVFILFQLHFWNGGKELVFCTTRNFLQFPYTFWHSKIAIFFIFIVPPFSKACTSTSLAMFQMK